MFKIWTFTSPAVPGSGRSSRASTGGGSRPPSRADSECSEVSEPEMYTTVQHESKSSGGRNQIEVTYQTHVVKTRTVGAPSPTVKGSKIPKPSSSRKKWLWVLCDLLKHSSPVLNITRQSAILTIIKQWISYAYCSALHIN